MMAEEILFKLLTPLKEVASYSCDAVSLFEKDNAHGQGGSLGVRPGHLPAVIALEDSSQVRATAKGNIVFSAIVRGGFARVDGQSVTVLTPEAEVTFET